jgi:hypothetical protein
MEVSDPLGAVHSVPIPQSDDPAASRQQSFADTGIAGPYLLRELDASGKPITIATIMVNAGHPQESNLTPNPLLADAMRGSATEADQARLRDRFDLWPLVLIAALATLLIEWLLTLRQERQRIPASQVVS